MTKFTVSRETFSQNMESIRESLLALKIRREDAVRSALSVEEIVDILLNRSKDGKVEVKLGTFGGKVSVSLVSNGPQVSTDELRSNFLGLNDSEDDEYNAIAGQLAQRVIGTDISVRYFAGKNHCNFTVAHFHYAFFLKTIISLFAGIIFGLLLKSFTPSEAASWISDNIFSSGSTMFLNALKMIVGPLVFFSMAASIAEFRNLKSLGRVAGKVVAGYLLTSLLAIAIGFAAYQIMPVGDTALQSAVTDAAESTIASGDDVTISIKDTIVNIIPSTFTEPFADNDMLQIIFMGIMIGIAVGAVSNAYPQAADVINCMSSIFSKITAIIVGFMPLAVFCSMAKMMVGMNFSTILEAAVWIPANYLGYIPMFAVYAVILAAFGRVNPIHFFRGFSPAMFTAFSLASSNAAMPTSMECCKKLGISRNIYSFSIPLGATINMNGSCIMLMISSLFMAKIFGVTISGSDIVTLTIAIMALSVGSPGVPGGTLVCLSMLLPQIGIPAEAISIIMGIYTICSMGSTTLNVTGDAAISVIVAKSEKMLDMKEYNAN